MSLAFDEFGRPFIIIRVRRGRRAFGWSGTYNWCMAPFVAPGPKAGPDCVQEQEKKQRIRGIDAQKNNIQAAKAITRILKSSLGPKGMDKMLQGPDGDVCISESRTAVLSDRRTGD